MVYALVSLVKPFLNKFVFGKLKQSELNIFRESTIIIGKKISDQIEK